LRRARLAQAPLDENADECEPAPQDERNHDDGDSVEIERQHFGSAVQTAGA
jgi:hypothetical protein